MKFLKLFFLTVLMIQWIGIPLTAKAVLVHNSLKEIEAASGKLQLKLIHVWGGDDEKDEHKFFKFPTDIAISPNKEIYIIDNNQHCIRVFDLNSRYLRTLSQKGVGPGDLYGPQNLAFASNGDLIIYEMMGRRMQRLTPSGKSKGIFKIREHISFLGVTSKDEILFYSLKHTFLSRKTHSYMDKNGKIIREVGKYVDDAKDYLASESIRMAKDSYDNVYTALAKTPVIRKYAPDGQMAMAITYETPFDTFREVKLNAQGDEIEFKGKGQETVIKRVGGVTQFIKGAIPFTSAIATDSFGRIYLITSKRMLTEKENMATQTIWINGLIKRDQVDYDIVEKIDHLRLIVFNPNGKVIAEAPLHTFCNGIYIYNNRLFVLDGNLNSRILEYEMTFTK